MAKIKVPHLPFYWVANEEDNWRDLIKISRRFREFIREEAKRRLSDCEPGKKVDVTAQDVDVATNAIDFEQVYREYLEFKGLAPDRVDHLLN